MKFDSKKFKSTKFEQRTKEVKVTDKDLKQFFDLKKNEKPVWVVRSLSGEECARANEAKRMGKYMAEVAARVAAAIRGNASGEVVGKEVAELLGVGGELPDDYSYRLALFEMGSVEPKVDKRLAVLLATRKPEFFYSVTNAIIGLIGEGQTLGESNTSGTTPA